ncbi:hypothetical protein M407DRAFT_21066 [Tulasnella calospora MUT 4182]|uniref:Uncharacterized protein n=1 Tax=Tulasnella calospora MUT 4182 TaxID=1051891 RepID=A0A0C3QEX0_9AGAM|nr:hypothetical protein M407DRAFT_21066 [Tulasnella calospora MUT 4182]
MTQQPPKLLDLCRSLEPGAQSHFLRTHVLDFLDDLDLGDSEREELVSGLKSTQKRWAKYPRTDFAQRKYEITELVYKLCKTSKLALPSDVEEANNIMVEIVWAILDWTKVLWIIGVEYGEQPELVHDALAFLINTLPEVITSSASSCTCIIPSIKIEHTFERTDGAIAEELQGPADRVVKSALMVVWRDMLLAQLARPENEDDTSPFIKNVLPSIMEDICTLGNMGVGGLFCLIDHETFEAGDGFESEDDIYIPSDGTEEDDSDDSDAMPPLMDIGSLYPPPKSNVGATEELDDSDDSDEDVPGLGPVSESSSSDSHRENGETSEAGLEARRDEDGKAQDDDDDDAGADISSLTWDLDEEEVNRLQERPRLEKLVLDFVVDYVKRHPSKDAFMIVTTSPLVFKRLDRLRKEFFDHFLQIPHTPHTFSQVLSIYVKEKATNHLTKLISANQSLSARCPGDMQDAASYFIGLTGAANRKQGAKIIMQAMETVIQDMVMEVEFGFKGVRKEAKRVEIMTILKTLKDDERKAAITLWVDQVITPPPEALSKEVQPQQPPVANFNNPMDVLAAMTALATAPAGDYNDPLGHDLIEMLDVNPSNPEVKPLAQRFRPDFSFLFESWKGVLNHGVRQGVKDCVAIGGKLCKDLQAMAPYLQSKLVVVEMKSRLDAERQGYLKTILTLVNRFMVDEVKKAAASRKAAQEGAKRPSETSPGTPPTLTPSTSSGAGSSTSPFGTSPSNTAPNFQFSPTPGGFSASLFPNLVPQTTTTTAPAGAPDATDIPQEYVDMIMSSPLGALFASLGNAMNVAGFGADAQEPVNLAEEEVQAWDSVD